MQILNDEYQYSPQKIIAVFAVFIALSFLTLIWLDQQERFPELENGYYSGSIRGITDNELYIFLHKLADNDARLLLIGQSPEDIKLSFDLIPYFEKKCCKSLNVKINNLDMIFNGSIEKGGYIGRVFEKRSNKTGSWKLTKISQVDANDKENKLLRDYVFYDQMRLKKQFYSKKVEDQKLQINSLQKILLEKQKLKGAASSKLKGEEVTLIQTKELFQKQQLIVDKLRRQVELGQKITPMGRLTAISRETLEKDRLWISGNLNYYPIAGDIVMRTNRIKRILYLQEEIEKFEISTNKNGKK